MSEPVIGYHGMFEPYVPQIRRLFAEGKTHQQIADSVPMIGNGQWRTKLSAQMVIYILHREKLGDEYAAARPLAEYNVDYAANFRRIWDFWEQRKVTAYPQPSWFETHVERLYLELGGIIKALEARRL